MKRLLFLVLIFGIGGALLADSWQTIYKDGKTVQVTFDTAGLLAADSTSGTSGYIYLGKLDGMNRIKAIYTARFQLAAADTGIAMVDTLVLRLYAGWHNTYYLLKSDSCTACSSFADTYSQLTTQSDTGLFYEDLVLYWAYIDSTADTAHYGDTRNIIINWDAILKKL